MKLTLNHSLILCVLASSIIFINSCKKDAPACTGNCLDVTIHGRVYNNTTDSGFGNVPVEVFWGKSVIFSDRYVVASGKTSSDGSFTFNTTIDTSFFKNNYGLVVRIPNDSNYIISPSQNIGSYNEVTFSEATISSVSNIQFEYYTKTNLTINIHKTSIDNYQLLSVDHYFTDEFGYGDLTIYGQQNISDTSINVSTTPGIYTIVNLTKMITPGNNKVYKDSIICNKNQMNVIDMNF